MSLPTVSVTWPLNLNLTGGFSCAAFTPPAGSTVDGTIAPAANINASKVNHRHEQVYAQVSTVTAAVEQKVCHIAKTAGTLVSVDVGAVTANIGAATVVFDLLKNGVTVLTATITLTSATAAYILLAGSIAGGSTTCVAGDVFEAKVVSATAGGGTIAKGPFIRFVIEEQGT